MTRRRFIALVSLCVLAMLGLIVVGTGYFVTQSRYGQDQLSSWVQTTLASSVTVAREMWRVCVSPMLVQVLPPSVDL